MGGQSNRAAEGPSPTISTHSFSGGHTFSSFPFGGANTNLFVAPFDDPTEKEIRELEREVTGLAAGLSEMWILRVAVPWLRKSRRF